MSDLKDRTLVISGGSRGIGLAIAMLVLTYIFLFKTNIGLKVRAVRRNRSITGCLGINTAMVDMIVFAYGSGLAGAAGAEAALRPGALGSLKEKAEQGRGGLWRDSLRGCGNTSSRAGVIWQH